MLKNIKRGKNKMGIYKVKGGYKVKSYVTGKYHNKLYKTRKGALKGAGTKARKKYYARKK